MSDYSQTVFFGEKDTLDSTDPDKVVYGAEWDSEFTDISDAIATKLDSADKASQAQAEAGADNATVMTPLRTEQAMAALFPSRGIYALDALSTKVFATSDTASTDVTDYTTHGEITTLLEAGKRYEFEIWFDGSGHSDQPNISISADVGLIFNNDPQYLVAVPYATGGVNETNLVLPSISTDATGDWEFQIDSTQAPTTSAVSYGVIRGVLRAYNGGSSRMTLKWRLTDFIGGEGAAWVNAGSYLRIRKLD